MLEGRFTATGEMQDLLVGDAHGPQLQTCGR